MVVRITQAQQQALGRSYRSRLARAIALENGRPDLEPQISAYIDEGLAAGVELDDDLHGFCRLLLEVDSAGKRPPALAARLADPDVEGELKVLQMQGAWIDYLEQFR